MVGRRISLKNIRALDEGEIIWDGTVSGFGARRQKGECVTYLLKYRTAEGRQRWFTIGRHGAPWTPDLARDEAIRILADVKGVSGKKRDPAAEKKSARRVTTVAELCDAYLSDAEAGRLLTRRQIAKRPSTVATDRGRIEGHIQPLLGATPLVALTPQDIDSFMHNIAAGKTARQSETKQRKVTHVRGGKGAATRTIGILGAIFTYAVRHQMCANNPVRRVVRFADGRRERRLTGEEYKLLGTALCLAPHDAAWAIAVDATRFLAVTGWRREEALSLRWSDIVFPRRTAFLAETKTGVSLRPLSHAACDILSKLEHSTEFVFPSVDGESGLSVCQETFGVARIGWRGWRLERPESFVIPYVAPIRFGGAHVDDRKSPPLQPRQAALSERSDRRRMGVYRTAHSARQTWRRQADGYHAQRG